MTIDREEAIEAVDRTLLAGLRAMKSRSRISAEIVDGVLALEVPDPLDRVKLLERIGDLDRQVATLEDFVRFCAVGKRPDGTYNHGRESVEQRARELLEKLRGLQGQRDG